MKTSRIVGNAAGSVLFTVVWEVAISVPAARPSWQLVMAGLLPQAVAGLSLALQAAAEPTAQAPAIPAQHRPVAAVRRRELTR
jgi:hypothetical protein